MQKAAAIHNTNPLLPVGSRTLCADECAPVRASPRGLRLETVRARSVPLFLQQPRQPRAGRTVALLPTAVSIHVQLLQQVLH